MTRQKRNPTALTEAQKRASGMQSVDANLDFGAGLSLSLYQAKIEAFQTKLTYYNTMLGTIDKLDQELDKIEIELKDYSGKMLAAVGARYGKRSWEYGEAGGSNNSKNGKGETTGSEEPTVESLGTKRKA